MFKSRPSFSTKGEERMADELCSLSRVRAMLSNIRWRKATNVRGTSMLTAKDLNDPPLKPVGRAVQNFQKRLQVCVVKARGHMEHCMMHIALQ